MHGNSSYSDVLVQDDILYMLTVCAVHFRKYSGYSVVDYPVGVQMSYYAAWVSELSCTVCYDQPYSHATSSSDINRCKSAGSTGSWIAMGAKSSDSASSFEVLAFIDASDLVTSSSRYQAYGPKNGAYWYYYNSYSVGFAASSSIYLNRGDTSNSDCERRLSWYLYSDWGGYRAGCTTANSGSWRKLMYSCPRPGEIISRIQTSCMDCLPGTFSTAMGASSMATCDKCPAGKFSSLGGATRCEDCPAGKHSTVIGSWSNSSCTDCDVGKFAAAAASTCTQCAATGKTTPAAGASSVADCTLCVAGKFASPGRQRLGTMGCDLCAAPPGNFCPPGSITSVGSACTTGHFCPGGTSLPQLCPSSSGWVDDVSQCLKNVAQPSLPWNRIGSESDCMCNPGFYSQTGRTLSDQSVTCSGSCVCTPSVGQLSGTISDGPGSYSDNEDCYWVISSNATITLEVTSLYTYDSSDALTIRRCESSAGPSSCIAYEQLGFLYGNPSGPLVHRSTTSPDRPYLQIRFYSNFRYSGYPGFQASWSTPACLTCPAGKFSFGGSTSCLDCPAGSYSPTETASLCSSCVPGTYSGVGASSCTLCEEGKFSNVSGASSISSCTDCPSGTFSVTDGALVHSACTHCPDGQFATPGSACAMTCRTDADCDYSSCHGFNSCNDIREKIPGRVSSGCLSCWGFSTGRCGPLSSQYSSYAVPAGRCGIRWTQRGCNCYNCDTHQVALCPLPSNCHQGTFSPSGKAGGDTQACVPCDCAPGFYCPEASTSSSGVMCPAGYRCVGGVLDKLICGFGTYAVSGASHCASCENGKFSALAGQTACTDCGAGKYAQWRGSSICTDCDAGKYTALSSSTSCTDCEVGKSSVARSGIDDSTCTLCGVGKYSNRTGASFCLTCDAGKFNDKIGISSCFLCPAGKYSTTLGGTQNSVCSDCKPGKYSALEGASSGVTCISCPRGKFSVFSGSNDVNNCTSPQCEKGKAALQPNFEMFQVCSSGGECIELDRTVHVNQSILNMWARARIQSWRMGKLGESCNTVCGRAGLTCDGRRFPLPGQTEVRLLFASAGYTCSELRPLTEADPTHEIWSSPHVKSIGNDDAFDGNCYYFEGGEFGHCAQSYKVEKSNFGAEGHSRLCACSVGDPVPYSVRCSGSCPCIPASGLAKQAVGTFSNFPSPLINQQCSWLISAPSYGSQISVRFPSVAFGNAVVISIKMCTSTDCATPTQVIQVNSVNSERIFSTSTGFLQVTFEKGNHGQGGYFEAVWSVVSEAESFGWEEVSGDYKLCVDCKAGTYSATLGSTSCNICPAGTFSKHVGATACTNCSAPAGHYCPQQSSLASGLICPLGYSCPGGAQDKLQCPSATGVGWSYCPEPLAITAIQSSASGGTFAEVCPKTPVQNFGEPQYKRCELRWSWTDLYAGHANNSINFKTGTLGEWTVYLYVPESVTHAAFQHTQRVFVPGYLLKCALTVIHPLSHV